MPGESVRVNERMCFWSGVVIPVTEALVKCKGRVECWGSNRGGAGAQDLVKSRTREEAAKLREIQAPLLFRLRLGRLEIARN